MHDAAFVWRSAQRVSGGYDYRLSRVVRGTFLLVRQFMGLTLNPLIQPCQPLSYSMVSVIYLEYRPYARWSNGL